MVVSNYNGIALYLVYVLEYVRTLDYAHFMLIWYEYLCLKPSGMIKVLKEVPPY